MKPVLLWGQAFDRVQAGAEQFTSLLEFAFPKLQTLFFDSTRYTTWPFLPEPSKARAVALQLQEQLEALDPDLVFFNGMYGWNLPLNAPYLKLGLCHGTFASFARRAMPWGLDRLRTQYAYSWFEQKSLQNAHHIISNSTFTRQLLQRDYHLDSQAISLAVDTDIFHPRPMMGLREKLGLPIDKKIVLFVGRPDTYKGFDLVQAISRLHPEWFFIAITFPVAQDSTIHCLKPMSREQLAEYYAACDAVFFPSRFESFGFVTLEALLSQKPIVTTPFGAALEIQHPYCLVVPRFSVRNFEFALKQALRLSPSLSIESLAKQYGLNRFARDYRSYCQEALKEKPRTI